MKTSLNYFSKVFLYLAVSFLVLQLTACANSPNPNNEFRSVSYGMPLAKTIANPVSVAIFSGSGITALHAYLPIGSQIDVTNPITKQRISAKVIGKTRKNQQNTLLLSSQAARALSLARYPNTKMMMQVSRKTNIATWPKRAQKKLVAYMPSSESFKGVFQSIPRVKSKRSQPKVSEIQYGKASYYARKFNGRKTASGERFDMNKMTCAHRTLPFGTLVRVTNQSNGWSVKLRVNDRGPFTKGRIVDVSFAAAKALGMIKRGTARVKLEVLK